MNTAPPVVSGPATVGGKLAATRGTWTGSTPFSYTYAWLRCDATGSACTTISAETATSHSVVQADVGFTLRAQVTATNSLGTVVAQSLPTASVIVAPLVNTVLPKVSGSAILGGKLTATTGAWTGSPPITYTFVWLRCDTTGAACAPISGPTPIWGGTTTILTLAQADVGFRLQMQVTATNSAGSVVAESTATAVVTVGPPTNTSPPTINGAPVIGGGGLTANKGTWTGSPTITYAYAWLRCSQPGVCAPIANATKAAYKLVAADAGSTIELRVTATNSAASVAATSAPTALVLTGGGGGGVATAISAGVSHTCALLSGGGVECWGDDSAGQLGSTMTNTTSSTPVPVAGLSSGVVAISAGFYHTCALTSAGGVECWGKNANGELGDGTTTGSATPVPVSGLSSGVIAISAGEAHTCAVLVGGAVECWGLNNFGQLGNGTRTDSPTPVPVTGLSGGVIALSLGSAHSCALLVGGGVRCWGDAGAGALGDGPHSGYPSFSAVPVAPIGLSAAVAVAAGAAHTCALLSGGAVQCWGSNLGRQVGAGSPFFVFSYFTPVPVFGLTTGGSALAAGGAHTCAVVNGAAECWGTNQNGQLGDGTTTFRPTPTAVSGLSTGVIAMAAGNAHTCALMTGGSIACWGFNGSGQLGDGSTDDRSTPVFVTGL